MTPPSDVEYTLDNKGSTMDPCEHHSIDPSGMKISQTRG